MSRARVATSLGDADRGAVREGDLLRPRDSSGGGVAHRGAQRLADGDDGVGGRGAGLALRLQARLVTGDEEHGNGCQQGDHHDGGRPRPPPRTWLLRAHPGSTAALRARRFPFARNGTPSFAAWALSSTFW